MSLFRVAISWSLRALVLWSALEIGATFWDEGEAALAAWGQIRGHQAAMTRLNERTQNIERSARGADAVLGAARTQAWPLAASATESLEITAARALRENLIVLGAEAPVVDGEPAHASGGYALVILTARWREPIANAPAVLYTLGAQNPSLRVISLALRRDDSAGLIETEAQFAVPVHVTEQKP